MSGCGCLGRVLAFIFAVLFIMTMAGAIWGYNINSTLLNADEDISEILNQDFYDSILPLVLPAMAEAPEEENEITAGELQFVALVENLERDDWESIAKEVVPGDYLERQVEDNLGVFLDYANGERARLNIVFETGVLRNNLLEQPGDRMVNRIFTSWEECDAQGEAQLRAFVAEDTTDFPYCKPTDTELQREAFTVLNDTKDELASEIPERWALREEIATNNNLTLAEVDQNLYQAIQRPTVFAQQLTLLNFFFPIAFVGLIMIVTVDSLKSFFQWVGTSTLISGILVLLPLLFVPILASIILREPNFSDDTLNLQLETLRGFILGVVAEFTMPILIQGAALVGGGFLMLLMGINLSDPNEELTYPQPNSGDIGGFQTVALSDTGSTPPTPQPTTSEGTEKTLPPSQ